MKVQNAKGVSILTRAFARVQLEGPDVSRVELRVSILTRAFARVQRPQGGRGEQGGVRFNPHSSFRPSATWRSRAFPTRGAQVSILTRAFARVQRPPVFIGLRGICVSILTRAFARVQRP